MYSFKSKVRFSECDETEHLSLTSIVNYFQDCCTFQSEELGVGWDYLQTLGRAWILNSWQIVVEERPALCEEITISTWPSGFKGFYGYRNFLLQDSTGRVVAYANSIWVYLDVQTGHPARIDQALIDHYTQEPPYPMPEVSRKIPVPADPLPLTPIPATNSYIDTNLHVNNSGYVRMGMDCLPKELLDQYHQKQDQKLQLRVEYRSAARLGDTLYPSRSITDDHCTIVLAAADGTPYSLVEFTAL